MKKPDYSASVDPLSDFPGCRALEDGIKAASSFWGDPAPYLRKAKNAGAIVVQTVATPEEAPRAAYFGTDIIVARGVESGGHVWSTVSTMVLVCDAAPDVPVVGAGGIAGACGVRAALALGAQGEWLGTRFLATVELGAHDEFKIRLVAARAKARSSVLFPTGSRSGAKGCRRQFGGASGEIEPMPVGPRA